MNEQQRTRSQRICCCHRICRASCDPIQEKERAEERKKIPTSTSTFERLPESKKKYFLILENQHQVEYPLLNREMREIKTQIENIFCHHLRAAVSRLDSQLINEKQFLADICGF